MTRLLLSLAFVLGCVAPTAVPPVAVPGEIIDDAFLQPCADPDTTFVPIPADVDWPPSAWTGVDTVVVWIFRPPGAYCDPLENNGWRG